MKRTWFALAVATLFLGCGPLRAQDPLAACGDEKVSFDVDSGPPNGTVASPAAGKAAIYIIEIFNLGDKGRLNRPTIRHGLNGTWLGATQGFTYLRADVSPGTQHLCSRWQSHFTSRAQQVSLYNFEAVEGKVYFFRAQLHIEGSAAGAGPTSVDLQPLSEDEGRFLITEAAPSISKQK